MSDVSRERSFDRIAAQYERARPGYPEALFDRIVEYGSLAPRARALEVGTGTGKATVALAERGLRMVCLEPGPTLASVARERLAAFPGVAVQTISFEAWHAEHEAFDLAFVAQAFHWLDPMQRTSKLPSVLRAGATLAIFGNSGVVSAGPLRVELEERYRAYAPELFERDGSHSWYASEASPVLADLGGCALLEDVRWQRFEWHQSLSSHDYCELIGTYSDHSTLPQARRTRLLGAIAAAIDAHGGSVTLDYTTGLFLARKRAR